MFSKTRTTPQIDKLTTPAKPSAPSLEQIHAEASGASAYAKGIFQEAVDELVDANARFDDVEIRATAEIDRLGVLREDATAQRRANTETIKNLQALLGS